MVLIDRGQVLLEGTVEAIRARVALQRVAFDAAQVPALPGVVGRHRDGERHVLLTDDADALVRALVRDGIAFEGLEVAPLSLEEAMLALLHDDAGTGRDAEARP